MTRPKNKIKRIFINITVTFITCLALFLAMEIGIRLYHRVFYGVPFLRSGDYLFDKELGWKGTQIFGDPNSKKFKIFIVGDSFTEGVGVSSRDMYYEVLKKKIDAEIFVYAAYGYGTLQEYIAIDRYLDWIKPDLVLLQVCSNDFINNHFQLEQMSFRNNNFEIRPYFESGTIKYRIPRVFGNLRIFFFRYSRFYAFIQFKLEKFMAVLVEKGMLQSVEEKIEKEGTNFSLFNDSVSVTEILMQKISQRIGATSFVVFTVDMMQPYVNQFKNMFEELDVIFIDNVAVAIKSIEDSGMKLRVNDMSHWNQEGNKIAGVTLSNILIHRGYIDQNSIRKSTERSSPM